MFERSPSAPPHAARRARLGRAALAAVATGGLLLATAPAVSAAPAVAPAQAAASAPTRAVVATRTVSATVHFSSGSSYLSWYSQRTLVRLLRSLPAGATVLRTTVKGYVQARSAYDNGRTLGGARAVEVRSHLRALGLSGRIDLASGGIAGTDSLSRRAVVTITYRPAAGQTIDFTTPDSMTIGDADQALRVSATSHLRVTVTSISRAVCTVVGTPAAVHAVAAGRCTLVASQPGSGTIAPAPAVTVRFSIAAVPTFTVSYDPRSGAVAPDSATFVEGADGLTLPTPTREGYTFDGWFTAAAPQGELVGAAGASYVPTGDVTLYAHWTEVPVVPTVTFHANYDGGPADTTQTSDSAVALTANPFASPSDGLTFAGWSTEPGGAVVYTDGATYDFAASDDLYAVWGYEVRLYHDSWMNSSSDIYYCGRADGNCTTANVTHLVLSDRYSQTTFVVFPNQNASDDPLNGFEISMTSGHYGVYLQGWISFDPALNVQQGGWFGGEGQLVRLDVTGSGTIWDGGI
jgi:uncharacterized repeat protein (TIGR02543 family)